MTVLTPIAPTVKWSRNIAGAAVALPYSVCAVVVVKAVLPLTSVTV